MAEIAYLTLSIVLSVAPDTQSARQMPKYCFLAGLVCCICNIPQYRLFPAEYRQPKLSSSYQLHHLVLRHLSQVVKNPPCSGFEPGTSQTRVRRSNHYTIELCELLKIYSSIWLSQNLLGYNSIIYSQFKIKLTIFPLYCNCLLVCR
jgi:hypothetical protein